MANGGDIFGTFQELRSIDMLSFFDQELRPTFVIDASETSTERELAPVFQNTFLRVSGIWAKLVPVSTPVLGPDDSALRFVRWARSPHKAEVEDSRSLRHQGIHWSKTSILGRWTVITGTFCSDSLHPSADHSEKAKLEEVLQTAQQGLMRGVVDQGYRELSEPDEVEPSPDEPLLIDRGHVVGNPEAQPPKWDAGGLKKPAGFPLKRKDWLDTFDWASTALGPRDTWDPQLRRLCKLMLVDPWPAAAYWGPEKLTLYNENYSWILGRKHPAAMGQPFSQVWGEVETALKPIFDQAAAEQKAVTSDDTEFMIDRNGFTEQTYFSWSMLPITDEEDQVVGYYNPTRETTIQKTLYRRMSLLLGLSQGLSRANTINEFWPQIVTSLDTGSHDVPFLLMYGAEEHVYRNCSDLFQEREHGISKWELKGTIGYPKDLELLPKIIDHSDIDRDMETLVKRIDSCKEPLVLSTTDGSFPARLMTTIHTRTYGARCSHAVLIPIRPYMSATSHSAAFMILGLNPRKSYDNDYRLFVQLFMGQMASSMAAVLLFTDTVHRGEQRAKHLSRQLATQTKIAEMNEIRFQRMADHAPVAMFKISPTGSLQYGNEDYFRLTESQADDQTPFAYQKSVESDDLHIAIEQWDRLSVHRAPVNDEMRLKKRWISPEGVACPTWVVAAAYPELDLEGNMTGALGCLTDISRQKWAEEVQARRTEQAIELKRQQEMFIDMTSHELRNPLSAVIQSADGIIASLDTPEVETASQICINTADATAIIDAAQTIIFCAQHQKRISDDVLILSKLNSDLVVITPVDVKPVEVITQGLQIFDRQLKKSRIQMSMSVDKSYEDLGIGSVRLDPSRMLQVMINLVSNAIKFTEPQEHRQVDVRFGASLTPDLAELEHVRFWDHDLKQVDADSTSSEEWGTGEIVYIWMAVSDTGRGLRADEMEYLFQRFSQISPRTHVQYGGSGLGLFICKRLAEAQGGAIGVSSVPEQGSTFAFYIKVRRSPPSTMPEPVARTPSDTVIIGETKKIRISIPTTKDQLRFSSNPVDLDSTGSSPSTSSALPSFSPSSGTLSGTPSRHASDVKGAARVSAGPSEKQKGVIHVLIVEDNLVNQKVLAKQLERAGHVVAIANHGGEALDHLRRTKYWKASDEEAIQPRQPQSRPQLPQRTSSRLSAERDHLGLSSQVSLSRAPLTASSAGRSIQSGRSQASSPSIYETNLQLDVVLMDLEMPVMDGIACVRRIRELQGEGKMSRVPVIAVTANARQEQVEAAKEAGMDSVVCKPFRIPQLMKEIDVVLKRVAEEMNAVDP